MGTTTQAAAGGNRPDRDSESLRIERQSLTLRQKACATLRKAIVDQRFPPGTRLIERDLCELLGVSRTSVREALRHLESEKLIEMVPHKGPTVTTLTIEDVKEIYEVRAALEGLAGERFAGLATDELIDELCAVYERLQAAAKDNDHQAVLSIKAEFYRVIFDGSRNRICAQMVGSLTSRIEILRRMSLASPGRNVTMMDEVKRIVDAARARDPQEMKTACIAHVNNALAAVIPQLGGDQPKPDGSHAIENPGT